MQHPKETYRCLHFRLDQFSFFHLSASHWMLSINKVTLHGNQLTECCTNSVAIYSCILVIWYHLLPR